MAKASLLGREPEARREIRYAFIWNRYAFVILTFIEHLPRAQQKTAQTPALMRDSLVTVTKSIYVVRSGAIGLWRKMKEGKGCLRAQQGQ